MLNKIIVPAVCVVIAGLGFLAGRFMTQGGEYAVPVAAAAGAVALILAVLAALRISRRIAWYESILDAIPFPLSVTDNRRRWTFVNAAVEGMLKKSRTELAGKPCVNWGAGICNTENCGINCLEGGKTTTLFTQGGMDFKVYIGYLNRANRTSGRHVGHVEIVEDMTELFKNQRAASDMTASISRTIVNLSGNVSEVAEKTSANAQQASKAAELTGSMKENADKGSGQMSQMIEAVQQIRDSAQTINKVINTINEIAFQTNLLALNASVEAARAGEAGKGFAVVADEVRNLATRSAQAANDTNSIIHTSIEKSELGFRIAGETASSLAEILDGLTNVNRIVADIASSSQEQSSAIQSINTSVMSVSEIIRRRGQDGAEGEMAAEQRQLELV